MAMKADEFVKSISDLTQWHRRSVGLRRSAEVLWAAFLEAKDDAFALRSDPMRAGEWHEVRGLLFSAHMLYGLAIETSLKGWLVKHNPSAVELAISANGNGEATQVSIKQIGFSAGDGHNLRKLAEAVGIFNKGDNALFEDEEDIIALRHLLDHLSEMVLWKSRYPVPMRSKDPLEWPPEIPKDARGANLRDWIDPLLDRYQSELLGQSE